MKLSNTIETYGIIYRYLFPNGKSYIGQATQWARLKEHIYEAKSDKPKLLVEKKIHQYFLSNGKMPIVCIEDFARNKREIDKLETKGISYWKSFIRENGYNLTTGGANGLHSQITKDKMSLVKIGKKRPDISKALIGKKRKPFSAEHKSNIAKSNKITRNRHENRVKYSLTKQLYWHEKRVYEEFTRY